MLDTPILLLIFNRPETTAKVFQKIRSVKPKKLYISADGPRVNNDKDRVLCIECRNIIKMIDWECELNTNFNVVNVGCSNAIYTAIDWFFEYEKEGIILEDDCLPSSSFFSFCSELLNYYKQDERVMCISGDNFQKGRSVTSDSYYYSKYNHCWGWATWRRAWKKYDHDMLAWPEYRDSEMLETYSDGSKKFIQYWTEIFNNTADGKIDSWAYRWTFTCWLHNGLTCLPDKNLVQNIGFGINATHSQSTLDWRGHMKAYNIKLPLIHPEAVKRSIEADKFSDAVCFGISDGILNWLMKTFKALKLDILKLILPKTPH